MTDGRTDERTNGKWKIGQCSVGPETAITVVKAKLLTAYLRNKGETTEKGIGE